MAGVTMTHVARAAGVSVSTVSHVVNGTRPVAPETKSLVLETMDRLGFVHRPAARSLAAGSTMSVGLAVSNLSDPFFGELADGLHAEARRRGLQLIIVESGEDPDQEQRVVSSLLAHHVDGLVMSPSPGWADSTRRLLKERGTAYVLLDRLSEAPVDQVGVENEAGSDALVGHLTSLGHTRIAMISGLDGLSTTTERISGYQRALRRAGLPEAPELVMTGNSTSDGAFRAMRRLLALNDRPTATFLGNASMSIGAVRALSDAGLRIPQDMALVCFDDPPWADCFTPQLTAIAQPCYAMGARAIQLLVRRMSEPKAAPQVLRLSGEFMHRTSCGCPPGADDG